MNIVELKLDETLADFEIQDWIDNVFNKQFPGIEAKIKKVCNGTCGNANRIKELEKESEELKIANEHQALVIKQKDALILKMKAQIEIQYKENQKTENKIKP